MWRLRPYSTIPTELATCSLSIPRLPISTSLQWFLSSQGTLRYYLGLCGSLLELANRWESLRHLRHLGWILFWWGSRILCDIYHNVPTQLGSQSPVSHLTDNLRRTHCTPQSLPPVDSNSVKRETSEWSNNPAPPPLLSTPKHPMRYSHLTRRHLSLVNKRTSPACSIQWLCLIKLYVMNFLILEQSSPPCDGDWGR